MYVYMRERETPSVNECPCASVCEYEHVWETVYLDGTCKLVCVPVCICVSLWYVCVAGVECVC